MIRLAFIVSHPVQYYVPLYRRLAQRDDVQVKVFYTWHTGQGAQFDAGFKQEVAWDIPLVDGYEHELVPNTSQRPGTEHFFGLSNPSLIQRVTAWQPDVVHLTGYPYYSHLTAMRTFSQRKLPVMYRGDSHLLDQRKSGPRWLLKRTLLTKIFSWPAALLYVGKANREYYHTFGVPDSKLVYCPHSIEVERFAEPEAELEKEACAWKEELKIPRDARVLLFVGKFEDKKRPVPLMNAFLKCDLLNTILVMVGDGVYGNDVRELASRHPGYFRVVPFQNQSRMPVVYRLGDEIVLPSAYNETWGLAINEAMACGRPALVSDRVGCGPDLIRHGKNGRIFHADDWSDFSVKLKSMPACDNETDRQAIKAWARNWSVERTADAVAEAAKKLLAKKS